MKLPPSFPILLVSFAAPLAALAASSTQNAAPTFELPRLKAHGSPKDPGAMSKAKATFDALSPGGKPGVQRGKKDKTDYLAIDGGKAWSSPLRGAPDETTFVSFFVYASVGTVIDVSGAKLLIRPGSKPDYAQLHVGTPSPKGVLWRTFGGPVKFEKHGGRLLAALPVLTLRLDPAAKEWDVFVANRLVADGLRLSDLPRGATRQFNVSAGPNGAWVCGLISADENPLYEDANTNGIDDAFERQQRGGALLAANAPSADRAGLASQWQRDQRLRNVRPWPVQRPRPDGAPATPPQKGK